MYQKSVFEQLPVKKKKSQKSRQPSHLQRKLKASRHGAHDTLKDGLAESDVQDILAVTTSMTTKKVPTLKSLCHFDFFCDKKTNRLMRVQSASVEHFEGHLDIRKFVSAQTNLALLIWLLLSKKQMLLFKYHDYRAIKQHKSKPQKATK